MSRARNASKKRRSRTRQTRKHPNNKRQFKDAMNWLFNENIFNGIAMHGNTGWLPADLSVLALPSGAFRWIDPLSLGLTPLYTTHLFSASPKTL